MSDELGRSWKEAVVAYFNIVLPFRQFLGEISVMHRNKDLDPVPPKYEYELLTTDPRSSMIRERLNLWNAVRIHAASNLPGCGALQDTKSFLSSLEAIFVASFPSRVLGKQVLSVTLFEPLRQ